MNAALLNRLMTLPSAKSADGVSDFLKLLGRKAGDAAKAGRKAGEGLLEEGSGKRIAKRMLDYNLPSPDNYLRNTVVSGAGSSLVGGLTGEKGEKGSRAIHWGILGAVAGRHLPVLASKGVGRVATNLIEPFNYDAGRHMAYLKKQKIKDMVKAVVKDQPMYEGSETKRILGGLGVGTQGPYSPREVPYRKMFGLKPRAFEDFFVEEAGNPGVLKYNRTNSAAKRELRKLEDLLNFKKRTGGVTPGESTLLKSTGTTGGSVRADSSGLIRDRWDFAINNPNELNSKEGWLRGLLNVMSNPYTLEDKANLGEVASRAKNMRNAKTKKDALNTFFSTRRPSAGSAGREKTFGNVILP